jgi:hypothetical protein
LTYKFTKYGAINALWSLVPIFPAWTLMPGIALSSLFNNCEAGYQYIEWCSIILTIFITLLYIREIEKLLDKEQVKIKRNFRWFSLLIYTLINTATFIMILGPYLACEGDGQTVLVAILSGPVASFFLILLGLAIDLKLSITPSSSPGS